MLALTDRISAAALVAIAVAFGIGINDAVANGCLAIHVREETPEQRRGETDGYPTSSPIYGLTAAGIGAIGARNVTADHQPTATLLLAPTLVDGPVWSTRREWQAWRRHLQRHGPEMTIIDRRRGWLHLRPDPGTARPTEHADTQSFHVAGWLQRATVWTTPNQGNNRGDDAARRCPRISPLNFHCAPPSWKWVRWWPMTVQGEKHGCIWAHPLEGKTIHLRAPFPATRGRLTIRTALFDGVVGDGGQVRLTAAIGERRVVHRHADTRGWQTADLTSGAGDQLHVTVRAKSVGRRHFCFDLDWTPESGLVPGRDGDD